MITKNIIVTNPTGLHLHPAGNLCNLTMRYSSKITFTVGKDDDIYDAKSVLSVLGACVKHGDEIIMTCDGQDEEQAMEAILALFENGLE